MDLMYFTPPSVWNSVEKYLASSWNYLKIIFFWNNKIAICYNTYESQHAIREQFFLLTYNIFIHREVLIWIKIYRNTLYFKFQEVELMEKEERTDRE